MNPDQDHLPETKKRELSRIVEILFAEFEAAIARGTMPYKRKGSILKIILFGSYARGDWVNDPIGGYISDYDLLVVVNDDKLTDITDYWTKAEDHLLREYGISHQLTAPASFIVHSLNDVNRQLWLGRYFFTDIARDGIVLYRRPAIILPGPRPSPRLRRRDITMNGLIARASLQRQVLTTLLGAQNGRRRPRLSFTKPPNASTTAYYSW